MFREDIHDLLLGEFLLDISLLQLALSAGEKTFFSFLFCLPIRDLGCDNIIMYRCNVLVAAADDCADIVLSIECCLFLFCAVLFFVRGKLADFSVNRDINIVLREVALSSDLLDELLAFSIFSCDLQLSSLMDSRIVISKSLTDCAGSSILVLVRTLQAVGVSGVAADDRIVQFVALGVAGNPANDRQHASHGVPHRVTHADLRGLSATHILHDRAVGVERCFDFSANVLNRDTAKIRNGSCHIPPCACDVSVFLEVFCNKLLCSIYNVADERHIRSLNIVSLQQRPHVF